MIDVNSYLKYDSQILVQNAVERNIEIIGEATNQLLKLNPDIAISNSRKIVNTRNKISHGYDEIENEEIWGIIRRYLPILKIEVENLLGESPIDLVQIPN